MKNVKLAPSILSADFAKLADEIRAAENGGADWIHIDVMDGHFVPNITIGPLIAAAARRSTGLPLDAHLMIEAPERFIDAFAAAGVDILTVHVETCPHLHSTVQKIKDAGMRAGVSLNPATPPEALSEILPFVDLILVMTVNPGFGGQHYIPTGTQKIRRIRQMLDEGEFGAVELEVDGGVSPTNAREIVEAGATVLVAGSAVYNENASVEGNLAALRSAAGQEP